MAKHTEKGATVLLQFYISYQFIQKIKKTSFVSLPWRWGNQFPYDLPAPSHSAQLITRRPSSFST